MELSIDGTINAAQLISYLRMFEVRYGYVSTYTHIFFVRSIGDLKRDDGHYFLVSPLIPHDAAYPESVTVRMALLYMLQLAQGDSSAQDHIDLRFPSRDAVMEALRRRNEQREAQRRSGASQPANASFTFSQLSSPPPSVPSSQETPGRQAYDPRAKQKGKPKRAH